MASLKKKPSISPEKFLLLHELIRDHSEEVLCLVTAELIEKMFKKNRRTRKIGWLTYRLDRRQVDGGEELFLRVKTNKISRENNKEAKERVLNAYRKLEADGYSEESRIAFYEAVLIKKY